MKNIDTKSLIIGALLTSTIFLGVAATSKDDAGKWDDKQQWTIAEFQSKDGVPVGWEPTGNTAIRATGRFDFRGNEVTAVFWQARKRIK